MEVTIFQANNKDITIKKCESLITIQTAKQKYYTVIIINEHGERIIFDNVRSMTTTRQ